MFDLVDIPVRKGICPPNCLSSDYFWGPDLPRNNHRERKIYWLSKVGSTICSSAAAAAVVLNIMHSEAQI